MRVFLDDVPVNQADPSAAAAVESLRQEVESKGRILVEILADGHPWAESTPPEVHTPIGELRCRSMGRHALACESFAGAASEVDALVDSQRNAADHLQIGKFVEAMDELRQVLERWHGIRAVYEAATSLITPAPAPVEAGRGPRGAEALVSELAARLEDLRRDVSAQRWVEVSDLLAYDLSDLARRWGAMLQARAEEPRSDSDGTIPRSRHSSGSEGGPE